MFGGWGLVTAFLFSKLPAMCLLTTICHKKMHPVLKNGVKKCEKSVVGWYSVKKPAANRGVCCGFLVSGMAVD